MVDGFYPEAGFAVKAALAVSSALAYNTAFYFAEGLEKGVTKSKAGQIISATMSIGSLYFITKSMKDYYNPWVIVPTYAILYSIKHIMDHNNEKNSTKKDAKAISTEKDAQDAANAITYVKSCQNVVKILLSSVSVSWLSEGTLSATKLIIDRFVGDFSSDYFSAKNKQWWGYTNKVMGVMTVINGGLSALSLNIYDNIPAVIGEVSDFAAICGLEGRALCSKKGAESLISSSKKGAECLISSSKKSMEGFISSSKKSMEGFISLLPVINAGNDYHKQGSHIKTMSWVEKIGPSSASFTACLG